jgi:hypothetical protein
MAELSKQALKVENNTEFPNNNNGQITPVRLRTFNEDMIDSTVNQTIYTADSASFNTRINNATGSVTSAITGSSLITASFNNSTRNLTFTKGDASTFSVNIPDVSGSTFNTGSFATTGSNTFTGNQTITTSGNTQLNIISTGGGQANVEFQAPNNNFTAYGDFNINNNGQYGGSGSIKILAKSNNIILAADGGFQLGQTNAVGNGIGAGAVTINVPTGSNTLQLTGSLIVSNQITASNTLISGDLVVNPTTSTKLNGNTDVGSFLYIGGGLTLNSSAAITWLGQSPIDSTFSASVDARINAITGSGINTGSFATTGSNSFVGNQTISGALNQSGTFYPDVVDWISSSIQLGTGSYILTTNNNGVTQYDNFQNIASALQPYIQTGSVINTGSFATTGSNTFNGNQVVSGYVSASNGFRVGGSANALEIGDGSNIRFLTGSSNFYNIQLVPGVGDIAFSRDGVSNTKTFTLAGAAGNNTTFQNNPVQFQSTVGGVTFQTPVSVNSGINTNVDITGSLKISSTFDAPLAQGYVWVGDASGRTTTVATSSFGGTTDLSSLNSFTASQYVSNSYFATTGSNNFRGVESIGDVVGSGQGEVYLLGKSGSLVLTNSSVTPTYASLSHISSSQVNANTNLIFKTNTGNPTTIVSGSGNIFANPSGVTAGFNRYVGGSGNIYTNVLPQITGSAAFPITMANNISNAGVIFRAPVSSSTYTVSSNLLMNGASTALSFGTSAANNFERAVSGLNVTNNIIAGTISAVAAKTPLSASSNMSANTIGGTVTLNYDSSSINLNGATVQGTLIVNNSYFPSTVNTNAALGINSGVFIGGSTIYASGSNATFTSPRVISNSTMFGGSNVISASFNGDNTNVNSTNLIGQSLTVYGTNSRVAGPTGADWGSVFAGRWNDLGGTKAYTAETVFAVGTGTGTSTRKTGFLIDSGSNTFVEGTLNVSGSTAFTGSTNIAQGFEHRFATGSNQQVGTATLDGASPSQAVVSNSLVTANSIIIVTKQTLTNAHSPAILSKGSGTFTIQSTGNGDTDIVGYMIINPSL